MTDHNYVLTCYHYNGRYIAACSCGDKFESLTAMGAMEAHKAHVNQVSTIEPAGDPELLSWSELFAAIRTWAEDRNLIRGSTPEKQFLKLVEEIGETAAAQARGNLDKVKDGIGDAVVCLTILAAQNGLDIRDCISAAYDEIKDRKGRMVDGIFVKEGD